MDTSVPEEPVPQVPGAQKIMLMGIYVRRIDTRYKIRNSAVEIQLLILILVRKHNNKQEGVGCRHSTCACCVSHISITSK